MFQFSSVQVVLKVVVRNLFAHSPRLYCCSCHSVFMLASTRTSISLRKGFVDRCPCCLAEGPFRKPTQNELFAAVPEARRQWPLALVIGIFTVVMVIGIWHMAYHG